MKFVAVAFAFAGGVAAVVMSQMLTGWWLNSGRGVAVMMAMLCALSIALVWFDRKAPLAVLAGMINATTVILFVIGPGSIFPIVLVFAVILGAVAIAPGLLLWAAASAVRSSKPLPNRHLD